MNLSIKEHSPPITVSSLDLVRLEQLLNMRVYQHLPGREALQSELDRADVVEPQAMPADVVTMNSTVRFMDEEAHTQHELTLVYPDEARPFETVSILAPIGSALLGLSVGQTMVWQIPGGRRSRLKILEVPYQPEAAGHFHR